MAIIPAIISFNVSLFNLDLALAASPDTYNPNLQNEEARAHLSAVPASEGSEKNSNAKDKSTSNFSMDFRPHEIENADISNQGQVYPIPRLEPIKLVSDSQGGIELTSMPSFSTTFLDRRAGITEKNDYVFFTLDSNLQSYAENLVRTSQAPHIAIVMMDPSSGKILSLASKSESIKDLALHTGFPAASVFKVITTAAALEKGAILPDSRVYFRGGTYTLNEWNYRPDSRRDRTSMTVAEALGKSCNPVFGRVGLNFLSARSLSNYAHSFGFNSDLHFDVPLAPSTAYFSEDDYELSRSAAGFGDVSLSPVHAATMAAGLAHGGLMPKPILIDKIISPAGVVKYQSHPELLGRMVNPHTARTLLDMMEYTTSMGTSHKEFMKNHQPVLGSIGVAAKTGTLKGENPAGITNWFVGAAPSDKPTVALAVVVMNPGGPSSKASHYGRLLLQKYFGLDSKATETSKPTKAKKSKAAYRSSTNQNKSGNVNTYSKQVCKSSKKTANTTQSKNKKNSSSKHKH